MRKHHTHPCKFKNDGCKGRVECDAPLERNYDGWPEVICTAECSPLGTYSPIEVPCEDCMDAPCCEECGLPEHLGHAKGCEYVDVDAIADGARETMLDIEREESGE